MRYYSLNIEGYTPPGFDGLLGGASYTNWVNGTSLPGAWNVEMDVTLTPSHVQGNTAYVRIHGVSWQEISQANNLYNKKIKIFGGMQAGLPLSNPKFAGPIFSGYIYQPFGNWVGTDMTLELNCLPGDGPTGTGSPTKPQNIVVNAQANQPMSEYLRTTLQTAFPGFPIDIHISPKLVRPNANPSYHQSLGQLADYLFATSKDIIGDPSYSGVHINMMNGNKIVVQDWFSTKSSAATASGASAPSSTKKINYQDLIGQPTWQTAGSVMSFKCPMRADINLNDVVTLPKTLVISSTASYVSPVNQASTFQGDFKIINGRHLGNFRQATADAWVTVYEAQTVAAVTK